MVPCGQRPELLSSIPRRQNRQKGLGVGYTVFVRLHPTLRKKFVLPKVDFMDEIFKPKSII